MAAGIPVSRRLSAAAVALLCLATHATAQRVFWQQPIESFAKGQTGQLTLVFENCSPKGGVPNLPAIDGLEPLGGMSRAEDHSWVNGVISNTIRLTYNVRPTRDGAVTIPALSVNTDRGTMSVPALEIRIGAAAPVDMKRIIIGVLRPTKAQVWQGEVFTVEFFLLRHANSSIEITGRSDVDWQPDGVTVENWGQPSDVSPTVDGQPFVGYRWTARCVANRPGALSLAGAKIKVRYLAGYRRFGIFTTPFNQDEDVQSDPITIEVKPLPTPEPPEFSGAVGLFKLNSRIVPQSVSEGYPITWTLDLSGAGNWNAGIALPARDVSTDFHVPPSKARLDQHENVVFDGTLTEDVVLIPTRPGTYTLGPVRWAYFNPATARYETIVTEPVQVSVTPAPKTSQSAPQSQPAAGQAQPPSQPMPPPAEVVPPAPAFDPSPRLPRDVLLGTASALRPIGSTAAWLCLLPAIALAIFWLALSRQRAVLTDSLAWRRRARTDAQQAIGELRLAPDPARCRIALTRWMRASAHCCGLPEATPQREHFLAALRREKNVGAAAVAEWERLWNEAETALYAPGGKLPEDWPDRAETALLARRLPRVPVFHLFLPRNLWPTATVVCLLFCAPDSRAEDAIEAYRHGDFAKAESLCAERVARAPTDWRARNNLALALAQQGRWSEAVAHWTAARVLNPRDASVAWNLGIALEKAGMASPEAIAASKPAPRLANFLNTARNAEGKSDSGQAIPPAIHRELLTIAHPPGPVRLLASLSPAQWQWFVVASSLFGATGFAIVLLAQHRTGFKRYGQPALAAPVLAALITVAAALAHAHYGLLADHSAAIVGTASVLRSIPSDIERQETKDLPAGTIGTIERQFLGWRLFRLPNGETGWVRGECLVPIYEAPPPKREAATPPK
ncbi:MAG TPA: BatD family protein [Verrucomicrobiae bacterium]|nr:BatD family protein [Verrucomicrobiae bacterium]